MQVTYTVWFGVGDITTTQEEVPCCKFPIPARVEWAVFSLGNSTSWAPPTNLSLVCLGKTTWSSPAQYLGAWGGGRETRAFLNEHSRCFLPLPAPESAPHDVGVSSPDGSAGIKVTWKQGTGKPWEYVVDWARDGASLDKLNWTRLPAGNLSTVLPG